MSKKHCKRCGKKWCGTNEQLKKLYPDEHWGEEEKTYGSKKCRDKGSSR